MNEDWAARASFLRMRRFLGMGEILLFFFVFGYLRGCGLVFWSLLYTYVPLYDDSILN